MSQSFSLNEKLMDELYTGILNYLQLGNVNTKAYAFAQSGFLSSVNLNSKLKPIVNKEIFDIGNSIPEDNLSYIPNGDFITTYSLFLNHLIPSDLSPNEKKYYQEVVSTKIALEKAFIESKNNSPFKLINQKINFSSKSGNNQNSENLLQKIKESESIVNKLLLMHQPKLTKSKIYSLAKKSQVPYLSEALANVSFITGARKIEGLNSFNMAVNSDPPKKNDSYAPKFEANIPADLFQKWTYNENNTIFPFEIKSSSQEPLSINQNSSQSIKSSRMATSNAPSSIGNYKIEAKFSGLEKVDLYPVNWFYPELFIQNGYHLMPSSPTYFGSKGILENIPSSIILAYNVQMKIVFTNEGFNSFDMALSTIKNNENLGISLGPIDIIPFGKQQNFNITLHEETKSILLDSQHIKSANLIGVFSRRVSNYIENPSTGWNCM